MHNKRIIVYMMVPILLIMGGWVLFNRFIRPDHYQLLYPYSTFSGRNLTPAEFRTGKNGSLQIFVPSGPGLVGKDDYEETIEISEFWIDQIPVTAGAYKKFVAETGALPPHYRNEYADYWNKKIYEPLPVVFISWQQAEDYCEYYGGHLPTEAQWEKAARGASGNILYWDDKVKAFDKANYDNFYHGKTFSGWLPNGKTVYGLLDMSGNVREWILDPLYEDSQKVMPSSWQIIRDDPAIDLGRMLKGGSYTDDVSHLRLNFRDAHDPKSPGVNRGFRCVYE